MDDSCLVRLTDSLTFMIVIVNNTGVVTDCSREMIVTVQTEGTGCSEGESRIQPASTNNIVSSGVKKNDDINESPDWGLIIGKV